MNRNTANAFIDELWGYYDQNARGLPWRTPELSGGFDGYKILVSEMMLQQTQVGRVIPKYRAFVQRFPTLDNLANSPLSDVLSLWSGLGYNRRAKYLHEAAKALQSKQQPWSLEQLIALKGIGHNTAAAICVYSYNSPHVFIETNIRTVYLYYFFKDDIEVSDDDIKNVLIQTLDKENPREFYWALMDYGTHLKKQGVNNISQSKHYKKQSQFQGSRRQVRGNVLKLLTKNGPMQVASLREHIEDIRFDAIMSELEKEKFIVIRGDKAHIA